MAREAFPVGAIDKNGANVKTKEGWKGLKSNFKAVDPTLPVNKVHKDLIKNLQKELKEKKN